MKAQECGAAVPQKHLHSRISYLYQAATYLTKAYDSEPTTRYSEPFHDGLTTTPVKNDSFLSTRETAGQEKRRVIPIQTEVDNSRLEGNPLKPSFSKALGPGRHLLSHLRAVSLKSQIRLTPAMKHSICKRCDTLLVPGSTSTSHLENKSRGGRKAWADVLVVTCDLCGWVRRCPVGARRQRGRTERLKDKIWVSKPGSNVIWEKCMD